MTPPMADAELGFSDANAATSGSQFANSGFRLSFHPGDFPAGSHNLYLVAHSALAASSSRCCTGSASPPNRRAVEGTRVVAQTAAVAGVVAVG